MVKKSLKSQVDADGADVKRAVLDATLAIASTTGPDAVSMREVARVAGVSHQAPYHYFGDRAGIFAAIAAEGFESLAAEFRQVLATGSHPSRATFEVYVRLARTHPGHFRIMFRADLCGVFTHEATRAAADAGFQELLNMVQRTVGEHLNEQDLYTWSSLLWSTAHGFATLLIDGPLIPKLPEGTDLEQHIDDVISLMTEMVESKTQRLGLTGSR